MERDLGTKLGTGSPSTISIPANLTPRSSSAVATSVGEELVMARDYSGYGSPDAIEP